MNIEIASDTLRGLLKLCFFDFDMLILAYTRLKPEYIIEDEGKELLEYLKRKVDTGGKPSYEEYSQIVINSGRHKSAIYFNSIKSLEMPVKTDVINGVNALIVKIELYGAIKRMADLYNGGKIEEAVKKLSDFSHSIEKIGLSSEEFMLSPVFKNHEERFAERKERVERIEVPQRIPSCIPQINHLTQGGYERGAFVVSLALRGIGKSTWLRSEAMHIAQSGVGDVLFFQAEGTKKEIMDSFDAAWLQVPKKIIKDASYDDEVLKKYAVKTKTHLYNGGGEIYVYVFDEFSRPKMSEVSEVVKRYVSQFGKPPAAVVLDYLMLFDPPAGRYDSQRDERLATCEAGRKVATSYNTVVLTAWQAKIISEEKAQDPNFYLTPEDLAEFKQVLAPATLSMSFNRTDTEKKNGIIRTKILKYREEEEFGNLYRIASGYNNGMFCDRKKTLELFFDHTTGTNKTPLNISELEGGKKDESPIGEPVRKNKRSKTQ